MYDRLREEELERKISEVDAASDGMRHEDAWKIVNEIGDRKKTKESQISCPTPEERVKTWFKHFKNLLGDPPTATEKDENIHVLIYI